MMFILDDIFPYVELNKKVSLGAQPLLLIVE